MLSVATRIKRVVTTGGSDLIESGSFVVHAITAIEEASSGGVLTFTDEDDNTLFTFEYAAHNIGASLFQIPFLAPNGLKVSGDADVFVSVFMSQVGV